MKRGGWWWLLLWMAGWGCAVAVETEEVPEAERPTVSFEEPRLPETVTAAHDGLLQDYEAVDAHYADLEEDGALPEAVARSLTVLRREYLRMQDHHLEWVETEWILRSGEEAADRRFYWHKAYRDLKRIGAHQEDLSALHRRLARLSGWLGGRELRQRHEVLAREHRSYGEYVRTLGEYLWEALQLEVDHEAMADPIEDAPVEDAPDGVISL